MRVQVFFSSVCSLVGTEYEWTMVVNQGFNWIFNPHSNYKIHTHTRTHITSNTHEIPVAAIKISDSGCEVGNVWARA